jgi:hypothetical protein
MFRTRRPLSRPALPTKSVPLPSSDLCAPSLPRPGRTVGVHPERLGAFGPLPSTFNSKLSTFNNPSLSPFPVTLASSLQLTENTATLSPVPATLTSRVKHKSFVCHSYKKTPAVGVSCAAAEEAKLVLKNRLEVVESKHRFHSELGRIKELLSSPSARLVPYPELLPVRGVGDTRTPDQAALSARKLRRGHPVQIATPSCFSFRFASSGNPYTQNAACCDDG